MISKNSVRVGIQNHRADGDDVADRLMPVRVGHELLASRERDMVTRSGKQGGSHGSQSRRRVIYYARYSTDEQNPRSIEDQFSLLRKYLAGTEYHDAEVVETSDAGISGEELQRPGIDRVKQLIQTEEYSLLIAEDLGRLYRDVTWLGILLKLAADNGVRVITVNEQFKSDDPGSQLKLLISGFHHAAHNEDVARRIKRAAEGRWDNGFSMGPLRPGYVRQPVDPESHKKTGKGPFRDSKDGAYAPIIREVFERIARGDPPETVASFLNDNKLRKTSNSLKDEWSARNVVTMIKNSIYMGVEVHGVTRSQKIEMDGTHIQVPNENPRRREVPHLAFVSASLWQQANGAIHKRNFAPRHPKGKDNPTYRVPRNSRSPLSNHFFCGICGGKMLGVGRDGGGYRCGNALQGRCWNKATVFRDMAHDRIFGAVLNNILGLDGALDALVELVGRLHREGGDLGKKGAEIQAELAKCEKSIEFFLNASQKHNDIESYATKLREAEVRQRGLLQELRVVQDLAQSIATAPTRQQILDQIPNIDQLLRGQDREAGLLLRQLITPIQAVPFQRIDCGLVVLRAKFSMNYIGLLPNQWQQVLRGNNVNLEGHNVTSEEFLIDLFDPSVAAKHALDALALTHITPKLTGEEIAQRLGTTRRTGFDAIKLGQMMEQMDLAEPYIELKEKPAGASRWRFGQDGLPAGTTA